MLLTMAVPAWAQAAIGKIVNVPEAEYHNTRNVISKSGLDEFARSPMHFRYYLGGAEDEPTEAMDIGAAFHCLALEPDHFHKRFVELPDFGPMQSSTNRAKRDEWLRVGGGRGKRALKPEPWHMIHEMRDALFAHPAARKLLSKGKAEQSCVWRDPATGLLCKARRDFRSEIVPVNIDLKTTTNASPDAWARDAGAMRYHVQDAYYSEGFAHCGDDEAQHFVFIVIEKEPPYAVGVYQLDDRARLDGEIKTSNALRGIAKCAADDKWPGYGDDVRDLSLPPWFTRDAETVP